MRWGHDDIARDTRDILRFGVGFGDNIVVSGLLLKQLSGKGSITLAFWSSQGDRIQCFPRSLISPDYWLTSSLADSYWKEEPRGARVGAGGGRGTLLVSLTFPKPWLTFCSLLPDGSFLWWKQVASDPCIQQSFNWKALSLLFCSVSGFCSLPVQPEFS